MISHLSFPLSERCMSRINSTEIELNTYPWHAEFPIQFYFIDEPRELWTWESMYISIEWGECVF